MSNTSPHIVIIGGGFGGLQAAKRLARTNARVTVVDKRNHHLFQPLLYQVATAGLSPSDIAEPIRSILRKNRNTRVVLGTATAINLSDKTVALTDQTLQYDYLIIASGVTHTYFGKPWDDIAPGLKSLEDAVTIRRRFLMAFERAEGEPNPALRRKLLTFVIVGGGPTGVELAGTMAEMAFRSLPGDFRQVTKHDARIVLVEGSKRLLSAYSDKSSHRALKALEKRGVEVRVNSRVTELKPGLAHIGDDVIECGNVFWAAGVVGGDLVKTMGVNLDRNGRVMVTNDCSVPNHPEVFVIGDIAHLVDGRGCVVPGVAQGAIQMGTYVGRVIRAQLKNKPAPRQFVYFDKGKMATIGRSAAVAETGKLRLSGFIAWFMWLFVHIIFLVGFDNRLIVMTQWIWEYLTFKRGARLITTAYRDHPDPH